MLAKVVIQMAKNSPLDMKCHVHEVEILPLAITRTVLVINESISS